MVDPFQPPQPPQLPPNGVDPLIEGQLVDSLAEQMGGGFIDALESPVEQEQASTRNEGELPGEGRGDLYTELGPENLQKLVEETLEMLAAYDTAMSKRRLREQEIDQHYLMQADAAHGSMRGQNDTVASELMMSLVDQAASRLVLATMGAKPLPRVDPIVDDRRPQPSAPTGEGSLIKLAEETEDFLHNFSMDEMGMHRKLPLGIQRATRVGTAVFFQQWQRRRVVDKWWPHQSESGAAVTQPAEKEDDSVGGVDVQLVPNRHVVIWPPDDPDWQAAEYVGHRFFLTRSGWRRYASRFSLDEKETEQIQTRHDDVEDEEQDAVRRATGINAGDELRTHTGSIKLTQLYMNITLPGAVEPEKCLMIFSEEHRMVLHLSRNKHFTGKHPYSPVRYKIFDQSAWGNGVGQEIITCTAADTAMRNLMLDNLAAGCYWLVCVRQGSTGEMMIDRPTIGQVVHVDKPKDDIEIKQMGGEALGLQEAIADNRYRAREASGEKEVLHGGGDPTMKSGAGTGSTLALIEQAGTKMRMQHANVRDDLSDFYTYTLELVTQHAPNGLFFRFASEEGAALLKWIKYEPLRGPLGRSLRVRVQAPDAATSHDGRKGALLNYWQFAFQHYQQLMPIVQQAFSYNPSGVQTFLEQSAALLSWVHERIAPEFDLPGIDTMVPELPKLGPTETRENILYQQISQLQQQIDQMTLLGQQAGLLPPPAPAAAPGGMPS